MRDSSESTLCFIKNQKYINEDQANILARSFILSNFNYCNLIWIFCSKSENSRIYQIHKRALRCLYDSPQENLNSLLSKKNNFDVHKQNLQALMLFIFKISKKLCPDIANDFFTLKEVKYNLRSKSLINLPKCNTRTHGINTIFFKGGIIWSNLPYEIKNIADYGSFARSIKNWKPKCSCRICIS